VATCGREAAVATVTCPNCSAEQEDSSGGLGFKCDRCGTETVIIECPRCHRPNFLHGSIPGGNQVLTLRCEFCNKKHYVSTSLLREVRSHVRAATRAQKTDERAERERLKAEQKAAQEDLAAEVDRKNQELATFVALLEGLLAETLQEDDYIDFESLKETLTVPPFDPGEDGKPQPPPELVLPQPKGLGRLLRSSAKHQQEVEAARASHEAAMKEYEASEASRKERLEQARSEYESHVLKQEEQTAKQHAEIDELRNRFQNGDPEAIVHYFSRVLEASSYPEGFPRHHRMAYSPESRQLVIEYQLPTFEVIPEVKGYKHLKTKNEMTSTARPVSQRKSLYSSVVAQTALRTLHEIFESNREEKVDTVVFNGYVDTVDRATGKTIQPYLVTLRTTRDTFESLDLEHIEPQACLKALNASLSRSPSELAPVRPVVDFNMFDPRFIEESDVLSDLDARPNLMELSPLEFESLITNLFEKMGLETRATRPSRDGGVDCVAWDNRPIFGGKVVIQAKRYKNTVGVAAVRDLFGTLHNEGANKGILVTTSGYGKAAFEFTQGKPIELLDGGNLLYLLREHTGIDAKIEPPEDWVDPSTEMIQ
jgi:restriction system protein